MDLENVSGLIRFLAQAGEASAVDLRVIIPTYDRMKRTLDEMGKNGLVEIEYVESPRIKYTYRLTEKGKRVAKKIEEMDSIIDP